MSPIAFSNGVSISALAELTSMLEQTDCTDSGRSPKSDDVSELIDS